MKGGVTLLRQVSAYDVQVLDFIRRYGPVSKAMIARKTGITAPTVTNICKSLAHIRLIREEGQEKVVLGRPSTLIGFSADVENYLVIHVRTQKLHIYVVNAGTEVLHKEVISTIGMEGDLITRHMLSATDEIIQSKQYDIKAIGLILRGPVDSEKGIVIFSPHAEWKNVPFKYIFEERYQLPVYMENDMHALTLGEYYFGAGQGIENLVVVKMSYGLGASLIIDGQLYRGFSDGAGELGHTIVAWEDGVYRSLEEVGSETSIRNYVLEAIERGEKTSLAKLESVTGPDFVVAPIYEAAVHGDKVAIAAMEKAGKYLGIALANIINLMNPEQMILSSDLGEASKLMNPILQEAIHKYSYRVHPIEISYSGKGYNQILRGMVDIICTARASSIWLQG